MDAFQSNNTHSKLLNYLVLDQRQNMMREREREKGSNGYQRIEIQLFLAVMI